MASNFTLKLDTTAPPNVQISIDSGAPFATQQLVSAGITCGDADTTGYQMLIWGNVDAAYDANVQTTEGGSSWVSFAASKQVNLSATDGSKTLYCKVRDSVHNVSAQASDSINLDTTLPTPNVSFGPDVSVVSKQTGCDTCSFSFTVDQIFDEYKVKVVPAAGSAHTAGTLIPTTAGSSNMSGAAGSYPASTPISCSIKGTDLETASNGDGDKIVKVFAKDQAGQWST